MSSIYDAVKVKNVSSKPYTATLDGHSLEFAPGQTRLVLRSAAVWLVEHSFVYGLGKQALQLAEEKQAELAGSASKKSVDES